MSKVSVCLFVYPRSRIHYFENLVLSIEYYLLVNANVLIWKASLGALSWKGLRGKDVGVRENKLNIWAGVAKPFAIVEQILDRGNMCKVKIDKAYFNTF